MTLFMINQRYVGIETDNIEAHHNEIKNNLVHFHQNLSEIKEQLWKNLRVCTT